MEMNDVRVRREGSYTLTGNQVHGGTQEEQEERVVKRRNWEDKSNDITSIIYQKPVQNEMMKQGKQGSNLTKK